MSTRVMRYPCLSINLDRIEHNARAIVDLCAAHGVDVTGVTKCVCGHPEVAGAMLRGGVSALGDSRLENIHRLRNAGVRAPLMLYRIPALSTVDEVVAAVDLSLNSELAVVEGLSAAAVRQGRVHDVVLMVDLGDRREGVLPEHLVPFTRAVLGMPGVRVRGIGTNLACFAGVVPDETNMNRLVALAAELEQGLGTRLDLISGVNSSGLPLLAAGQMPHRVNHARIGEGILLGRETVLRQPWPGTFQDAFLLYAEVLELKEKPSVPVGRRSQDAFGDRPAFAGRGKVLQALLNVGREDVDVKAVHPLDARVRVLGATSGYLVADVTAMSRGISVGEALAFSLGYSGLLAAMTSGYVEKHVRPSDPGGK